jgi:NAD(P)-dependent dehydrogenase (short-subunit alcohol dehydrogenase family)
MKHVILITGASRGLGRALATEFHDQQLALVARHPFQGPDQALVIQADVGLEAERIVEETVERFGRIDILINNASSLGPTPMPLLKDARWQDLAEVLHTNVLAPLHLTQLALPHLKAVVNITSDAGVEAYPGWGAYGLSKAALEHQTRTLAEENPQVAFVAVDPGDMDTDMHRAAMPEADPQSLQRPEAVAAKLAAWILGGPRSGRFRLAELVEVGR